MRDQGEGIREKGLGRRDQGEGIRDQETRAVKLPVEVEFAEV